ncbi:MAG: hypothetical protein ACI4RA_10620 [Kiritimatiellia bacterium]
MAVGSRYVILNSDGTVVATIGATLPTAQCRACSKTHVGAASSTVRPFYCYEFQVGGILYYFGFAGVNGTMGGLACNTDLNRTATAPYDFSANGMPASNETYGVQAGRTLYLYGSNNPPVSPTAVLTNGMTVYNSSGTAFTVNLVYDITVTAVTNSVGGTQVGNIAIYDGNTLVAGSVSKTVKSGTSTYSATLTKDTPFASVKIVATAVVGTTSSSKSAWHQSYFFNGMTRDGSSVSDASLTFSEATATYETNVTDNVTFVCDYGAKHALTVSVGTGVASSTVSYSRHHSTGGYVTTAISPVSLSVGGTLYVEHGSNVSASASCSSGYVFSTGNGFISQTDGVNSIYGANSSSISGTILSLTKAASFNLTVSTYTISVSIADHPEWGEVYIDSDGTTEKTLEQGRIYTFHFASSRADYEAPTVASWYVNGTAIEGNGYTADTLSGNVSVTCMLAQNAWPVAVSAASNGTARISGRYNKQSGAQLANTGYLRADGTDYVTIAVTPNAHYGVVQVAKSNNLSDYEQGGEYAYSLSGGSDASISFYFALVECVVRTSTNDPTLCDTSPAATALRFDAETSVNVYCQIKEAYIGQYRVDYFEAGGAHYEAELGGSGQYYYTVYAAILGGNSELTFVPHLVSTSNKLTVTKSGIPAFATVYIQIDGGAEESMAGSSWNAQVRENRPVVVRAVAAFGGKIDAITSSGMAEPSITESQISFSMPANDAGVDFAIAEREKVTLALCVANATAPDLAVGKVTLTCPASASVHEEVSSLAPQSFSIYKATTYTLTADDADETYTFSGWYLNDSTLVSTNLSIAINRVDLSSKYTARYVLRTAGTIATSYGIKSGDNVIPTTLPSDALAFGLKIDTAPDQTDPDRWVVGNSRFIDFRVLDNGISVEDVVTYVWTPVRVDVMAGANDSWTTVWTYDANNPDSRKGRFVMRDADMRVRLVFTKVQAEGYARVKALFVDGNTGEMGELSIFATGMLSYSSLGGVAEAACFIGRKVVLAAAPKPGHAFGGWFRKAADGAFVAVESNGAVLTVDAVTSAGMAFYADFARSDSHVRTWNDGATAKTFEWRSKVFVGAQFLALRNVRVYSDAYPVTLTLMTATSPNGCFGADAHTLSLTITSQTPRQIPVLRLEKYFAFKVQGAARINHVAVASSMEGLK